MKAVIQRVSKASVTVESKQIASISKGLLIFLGVGNEDSQADVIWLSNKVANLRVFPDDKGVMNLSMLDLKAEIIVVSQFTLHASTKKGNRPSYIKAAKPDVAIPLYESFISQLQKQTHTTVQSGKFGADMNVDLINDGPVTLIIDTKNKV